MNDSFDPEERAPVGPRSFEGEGRHRRRGVRGLAMRAVVPNAITAAALCSGLTGVRFAIAGDWEKAVLAVMLAALLDGIDGRIARLLGAQSRFGAELDSLSDSLSFGMAPAVILFLWSLEDLPRFGWFAAVAFALCCALRLARFNAQIDVDEQPHKSAGFLTGVPAPMGATLAFLPLYLWIASGEPFFRQPLLVAIWVAVIAFLMISNLATLGWSSIRPGPTVRLEVIALAALLFVALLLEPWWTLAAIATGYLLLMPLGVVRYARIKRQRGARKAPVPFDASSLPK